MGTEEILLQRMFLECWIGSFYVEDNVIPKGKS